MHGGRVISSKPHHSQTMFGIYRVLCPAALTSVFLLLGVSLHSHRTARTTRARCPSRAPMPALACTASVHVYAVRVSVLCATVTQWLAPDARMHTPAHTQLGPQVQAGRLRVTHYSSLR